MSDRFFMECCEALAAIAAERQESPVGSVVVLAGQIIGEGIEAGPHTGNKNGHGISLFRRNWLAS